MTEFDEKVRKLLRYDDKMALKDMTRLCKLCEKDLVSVGKMNCAGCYFPNAIDALQMKLNKEVGND